MSANEYDSNSWRSVHDLTWSRRKDVFSFATYVSVPGKGIEVWPNPDFLASDVGFPIHDWLDIWGGGDEEVT